MAMTPSERVMKSRLKNDHLEIRPSLAKGKEIREAAKRQGVPLTVYITEAIEMRMAMEKEQEEK